MMAAQRRIARSRGAGPAARSMAGAGLIEVMIAVLLLSFGMLGLAGMQLLSLRSSHGALQNTQAVIHSYEIFDVMRANRDVAEIGEYDIPMTCDLPEPDGRVNRELRDWLAGMKRDQALGPNACGRIVCRSTSCEVTVQWRDPRMEDAEVFVTRGLL